MHRAQGLYILNQAVLQKEADLVNEEPSVSVSVLVNPVALKVIGGV